MGAMRSPDKESGTLRSPIAHKTVHSPFSSPTTRHSLQRPLLREKMTDTSPESFSKQRKVYMFALFMFVVVSEVILHGVPWKEHPGALVISSSTQVLQHDGRVQQGAAFGFYLFGDVPYAEWEEDMLEDQIADLKRNRMNHSLFTVHVGDIQRTQRSNCEEEYYRKIQLMLRKGPLPTFMVAGDNDWYDCPVPKQALERFGRHFFGFHQLWSQSDDLDKLGIQHMQVTQHEDRPELFVFTHGTILFMSVHLINGKVADEPKDEWDARMEANIMWIRENIELYCSQHDIRGVIIFGHAVRSPRTRPLFEGIFESFRHERTRMPVLYLHGDGHDWGVDDKLSNQLGWRYFRDVQVDQGAFADPILVEIASMDANGEVVPLKVEHDLQVVFGRGLIRIDRQRGRYGKDILKSYGYTGSKSV